MSSLNEDIPRQQFTPYALSSRKHVQENVIVGIKWANDKEEEATQVPEQVAVFSVATICIKLQFSQAQIC